MSFSSGYASAVFVGSPPQYLGALASGMISTFQVGSGGLGSGAIGSGGESYPFYGWPTPIPVTCHSCNRPMPDGGEGARYRTPLFTFSLCLECANYDPRLGRVATRYDWIKDTVPLTADVPDGILADWLEDHDRQADADYIRNRA